jgi:GDP-4-dehydro-6-deoxy-D-mannose reductase
MKFLITGITGFAGPHLANLLIREGHEVWGLVRESNGREQDIRDVVPDAVIAKLKFVYGDLTNARSLDRILKDQPFDGCFHLAAQSHPPTSFLYPHETFHINAMGTANLVDSIAILQPQCKVMFCSTSEVYGNSPESAGAITEEFPLAPMNPYAVSKAASDFYVRERAKSAKLDFFVSRAFSHTGPRRGRNFSISSDAYQIARIKKGLQEPVINVGTLSSKRVMMDVRDCVLAYHMLMQKFTPGEAYNVAGEGLHTIGQVLDMMIELRGLTGKVEKRVDPKLVRPIDIDVQIASTDKCKALTGWRTEIPLKQTLDDLLSYWESKIQ